MSLFAFHHPPPKPGSEL